MSGRRKGPRGGGPIRRAGGWGAGSKPTPGGPAGEARFAWLADRALLTGAPAFDGDIVAVPDVAAAEAFANGLSELLPTIVAQRADGRTVSFYPLPAGWSS